MAAPEAGIQACPLCCARLRPDEPAQTRHGSPRPWNGRSPRFRLTLVPNTDAPAAARRALDGLADDLDAEAMDAARLVLSELVSNAVIHGAIDGGWTRVAAWLSPSCLRIEVEDRGPGFEPAVRPAPDLARSGWGLQIVDDLSERWGVTNGGSTAVWCELPRRTAQEAVA